MQYYWFVKPEYYKIMNKILKCDYNDNHINHFIKNEPDGIYVTYQKTATYKKWGYMPYYHPDDKKESKIWLEDNGYEFKYELSRKTKLDMLNKIFKK